MVEVNHDVVLDCTHGFGSRRLSSLPHGLSLRLSLLAPSALVHCFIPYIFFFFFFVSLPEI